MAPSATSTTQSHQDDSMDMDDIADELAWKLSLNGSSTNGTGNAARAVQAPPTRTPYYLIFETINIQEEKPLPYEIKAVYLRDTPAPHYHRDTSHKYWHHDFEAEHENEWKAYTVVAEVPMDQDAFINGGSPDKEHAVRLMNYMADIVQQQALNRGLSVSYIFQEDEAWEREHGKVQMFLQTDKALLPNRLTWHYWILEEIDLSAVG